MTGLAPQKKSNRSLFKSPYADILQFVCLLLLLSYLFSRGLENLGYNWQWYQVPPFILEKTAEGLQAGPLLFGLGITLKISALSLVLAFLIGLLSLFIYLLFGMLI